MSRPVLPHAIAFGLGFGLVTAAPACDRPCSGTFDCPSGSYCHQDVCVTDCVVDDDCPRPECDRQKDGCVRRVPRCDELGRCLYVGAGRQSEPQLPDIPDGWDAPVGAGAAFVVDALAIAAEGVGVDLDQRCRSGRTECVDNALAPLGRLGNAQIQQGVAGGESPLLLELAGVDQPFRPRDASVTLKVYGGRDADDFLPNNFTSIDGAPCCEFKVRLDTLNPAATQAHSRVPARIDGGRLSLLAPASLDVVLSIGTPPNPALTLQRALITGDLGQNLDRLSDGQIAAAIAARDLARVENPFCRALSTLCPRTFARSSLLDLVAGFFQPDIDLSVPPDGLDRLSAGAAGTIDRCDRPRGGAIAPVDPARPESCTESPELEDGFSLTLEFSALPARIVGIGN